MEQNNLAIRIVDLREKANSHTPEEKWVKFIEENELLDDLEESVSIIDFEEE